MNRQLSTWKFILDNIKKEIPVMLLYVLESKGSSPGRQGFFMAVNADKKMEGSIGGGIMEHKFVEKALGVIRNLPAGRRNKTQKIRNKEVEIRRQLHDKTASKDQSGMICSGEQTILIYRIHSKDKKQIKKLLKSLRKNENGTLLFSPLGIKFSKNFPSKKFEYNFENDESWNYAEKTGYKNHLYIIGGGHCALALSGIMSTMDFYIHLFEERKGLNTMEANNYVHDKKNIKDYSELATLIPPGENNYVVVMTFGYRTDDVATRALLGKDFKYFGLLGSRKKVEKMFEEYRKDGIDETLLNRIHSPVGIQIKSETPEEIAVSIAAEIIKIKNTGD